MADFSVRTTAILLLFVLIAGPTAFIIQMGLTNLGDVLNNFITLSTDMDPIEKSGVTEGWTVFYWAWWGAYMPFQSMFIAKISRGRTVREMLLGALVYASLGCAVFYIILGGFGLNLQLTGEMDVVGAMSEFHPATVVMQMADHLPLAAIFQFMYAIVCAIFMATTFDAATFALAATTTKRVTPDEDPARWNRMFWAFAMALVPVGILMIDGPLTILQTASVLTGIPIIFVVLIGVISFFRDYRKNGWVEE